jgi:hypothetical protein
MRSDSNAHSVGSAVGRDGRQEDEGGADLSPGEGSVFAAW